MPKSLEGAGIHPVRGRVRLKLGLHVLCSTDQMWTARVSSQSMVLEDMKDDDEIRV